MTASRVASPSASVLIFSALVERPPLAGLDSRFQVRLHLLYVIDEPRSLRTGGG